MQCFPGRSRPVPSGGDGSARELRPQQQEEVPEVEHWLRELEGLQQEAEQMRLRLGETTGRLREILGRPTPGPLAASEEPSPPTIPRAVSPETNSESSPLLGSVSPQSPRADESRPISKAPTAASVGADEDKNCLKSVVEHKAFEVVTATLVVCYGICLGVDVHVSMTTVLDTKANIPLLTKEMVDAYHPWLFAMLVFAYFIEMALRVLAYRWGFFYECSEEPLRGNGGGSETAPRGAGDCPCAWELWEKVQRFWNRVHIWNVCDLLILLFTLLDLYICLTNTKEEAILVMVNFRSLRIARFLRTLRLFSVAMKIPDLRKMIWAVFSCTKSFVWGMILMFLTFYFFAIFLEESGMHILMALRHQLKGAPGDTDLKERVHNIEDGLKSNWDGLYKGMLSLIFAVSGGQDWAGLGDPFLAINVYYGCVFTGFIFISLFGTLNVLVGVFVQKSGEIEQWEHKLALEEAMDESTTHHEHKDKALRDFFKELVKRSRATDNTITVENLKSLSSDHKILKYFRHFGIHVDHHCRNHGCDDPCGSSEIFKIFDTNTDGELSEDEFVQVCRRLQGSVMPAQLESLNIKIDGLIRSQTMQSIPPT